MKRLIPRRPTYYGWWIVASGLSVQTVMGMLVFQSFGAYAAVLRDEFGWSRTLFSIAFATARVENGLFGPLQGWMIDRFGPRRLMQAGILLLSLGFFLFSRLDSQATFLGFFFIMAVGNSLAGFMTLTVTIVYWFEKRRTRALGIMSAGLAIGGLLVPLVVLSLETIGWRDTALISGFVVLFTGLPLSMVIRHRPEDYGLHIDGIAPEDKPTSSATTLPATNPGPRDFTTREALRTPAFWWISLGHSFSLLVVSAIMVHMVIHINEGLGFSLGTAAIMVLLMTAFMILGQVGGGFLGDKYSKRYISAICMVGHMVALLFLAYATALWMVAFFAALHGLSWGIRGPLMAAIRADYFGRSSFATIMGFSSIVAMAGMTVGPFIASEISGNSESLKNGFAVLALLSGVGAFFFIFARPPRHPGEATVSSPTPRSRPSTVPAPAASGD
jgi:sugar phosphate permease